MLNIHSKKDIAQKKKKFSVFITMYIVALLVNF